MIDFSLPDSAVQLLGEVKEFLDEHLTPAVQEHERRTGDGHNWEFHRALAEKRWVLPTWPVEKGGAGLGDFAYAVMIQELYRAEAPLVGVNTTQMPAAVIRDLGSDDLQRRILPEIAAGEAIVCLGLTEPHAGSDLAAATTRARRDGSDWVIDGQKMFTTLAHIAQYCYLLARTTPDSVRHNGLTVFMVPMDTPGIQVTPIRTVAGERTNAVFYDGVRIPDEARIGQVDRGWDVMRHALGLEHQAGSFCGAAQRLWSGAVAASQRYADTEGRRLIELPANRERLARAAVHNEITELLHHRTIWLAANGEEAHVAGAETKLYSAETFIEDATALADMLGSNVLSAYDGTDADDVGIVGHSYQYSAGTSIYGGTSEIMRGLIAEHGLGLPKAR
ncbi:MAG: acyl-CoA dehydrogenase family protein [Mycobacterium sp.]